jgi:hypothetical protein
LTCALVSLGLSVTVIAQDRLTTSRQPTFTRPTLVANPIPAPARWRDVIFEDASYKVVSRDYGSGGGQVPGLFIFSKKRNAWIEGLELSTEHANLGRSPDFSDIVLAVGWDYGTLINRDYASLPLLTTGSINFPDRIVEVVEAAAYRFDFNSRLQSAQSLTSFWVRIEDLEAAFEGRRRAQTLREEGVPIESQTILLTDVSLNRSESLLWLVDTGSDRTYADSQYLRLHAGKGDLRGVLSMRGAEWADALVRPAELAQRERQALAGILGAPFFRRFTVTIDYDRGRMYLDAAHRVDDGGGRSAALELLDGAPVLRVPIAIAGGPVLEARLMVETGRSHGLVLDQAFVTRHKLLPPANALKLTDAFGVQGGTLLGRASLQFGRFTLRDFPVSVSMNQQPTGGNSRVDGSIGNGVLRRFRITLDHQRGRMIVHPSSLVDAPYDYDLTGCTIVANGQAFAIGSVAPGTIADKAGLRAGDLILRLDGKPTSSMSLEELRSSFRQDGRERSLVVDRQGSERTIVLKMQIVR